MEKIAVYGAGVMGSGEATLITGNGFPCVVIGRSESGLERCRKTVEQNWDDLIAQNLATAKNKEAAMKLLTITNDVSALKDTTFVFEAVAEDVKQKGDVYLVIEKYAASNVIIASCTSSLSSEDLAATVKRPENMLIVHPLNPTHMIPLVELVANSKNTPETIDRTKAVLKALHRKPVTLSRSVPGILVNRFHQAIYRESIYLIEQGVTTAEDINLAFTYLSMRYASIGVLEFFDDVGLELETSISKIVYPSLCGATEVQNYTVKKLADGKTGKNAGEGLLDWSKIDADDYRYRKQAAFFPTVREWDMPE
jgi:3-hydroxybutyryl-CoA dehydrogenase